MNRAYRCRIYPNKEQQLQMTRTFGCCRFIYNIMLSDKIKEYEKNRKMLRNTPAQYKKEYPWLKEVDALALSNVQLHLEKAYKNFFRDPKVGFPKFKSKHRETASYTTNMVKGNIRIEKNHLKLPKMSPVRMKLHREIPGNYILKSVTVTMEPSGKYYASLLFVCENQAAEKKELQKVLGIDYAMNGLGVFSDGTRAEYPGFYRKAMEKLAAEQRKLSHCVKGSRNYQKQKRKVALVHEKIRNQRKDYQHKLSRKLAAEYDAVCVEDLKLKELSSQHHFGKSVMDNGYTAFLEKLSYKLEETGGRLIKIDPYYPSSKTCSCCGKIKEDLSLADRIYQCECGNCMDRDVNAAINIRSEGIRIISA